MVYLFLFTIFSGLILNKISFGNIFRSRQTSSSYGLIPLKYSREPSKSQKLLVNTLFIFSILFSTILKQLLFHLMVCSWFTYRNSILFRIANLFLRDLSGLQKWFSSSQLIIKLAYSIYAQTKTPQSLELTAC